MVPSIFENTLAFQIEREYRILMENMSRQKDNRKSIKVPHSTWIDASVEAVHRNTSIAVVFSAAINEFLSLSVSRRERKVSELKESVQ